MQSYGYGSPFNVFADILRARLGLGWGGGRLYAVCDVMSGPAEAGSTRQILCRKGTVQHKIF